MFLGKRETITFIKYVLSHIVGIALGKHILAQPQRRQITVQSAGFVDITQFTSDGVSMQILACV